MGNKAVFLDRDGVLIRERGEYTYKIADFEWVDETVNALKLLDDNGFLLIIISNQGGISKGIYDKQAVLEIDEKIRNDLAGKGIKITGSYYCPHHSALEKCLCRKPRSLMLEKAVARYGIDVSRSFFIGDHTRDMLAGQRIGIRGVLTRSNESLLIAANNILNYG